MDIATFASRAASALLAMAVLAVLVLAVGPRTGAYRTLTILSDSMAPGFEAGDMIVVTPAPASSVRVGDVITYVAPIEGRPTITHRVDDVLEHGDNPVVITRGDANGAADPWVARLTGDTIWRQQAVVPLAGSVIRTLRQDGIRQLATWGLPAMLVVLFLIDTWRPRRDEQVEEHRVPLMGVDDQGWAWLDDMDLDHDRDIEQVRRVEVAA